ncbi:MAG: hypothetical protein PHH06_01835 [Candidatus Gracilibacteria bacterium]|nr:hypothetical protein [Candidatus Gracilibacteria bacterium]
MSEIKEVYKIKKLRSIYVSIGFFAFVVVLTGVLFFYNSHLDKQTTLLQNEITQKENSIKEKKENKAIQIYELYILNKKVLERLDKNSQIVSFLNHIEEITQKYNVVFEGFNYSNGMLSLDAITVSDDNGFDYQKASKFIEGYRNDEESLFNLGFIETITTIEDKEKFNIKLELK